jgi:calpain-15
LCKNGEWQQVTVDDWFPCVQAGGKENLFEPAFSLTKNKELWLMILEKAFAKLNGSYLALRSGYTHEALQDLTGCPTLNYDLTT